MQTRFRVWLASGARPVWGGVKLVYPPEYVTADALDVTVDGDGSDLRRLIADRWNIFAAYLQTGARGGAAIGRRASQGFHYRTLEPPPQPPRQQD
jgi:hypothetical protein